MPFSWSSDILISKEPQLGATSPPDAGRFDQLDREPIAEEIEDVGKSEQRELACRMAVLLADLLKWQFQTERRGASWETTIRTQRASIERRRRRTPSLATSLEDPDWWADAWDDALDTATRETDIPDLPRTCPWGTDRVLDSGFLPADAIHSLGP